MSRAGMLARTHPPTPTPPQCGLTIKLWRQPIASAISCNDWDVFGIHLANNSKICNSFLVLGILFHSVWSLLGALSLCLNSIYFVHILSSLPTTLRFPPSIQLHILSILKEKKTSTKQKHKKNQRKQKKTRHGIYLVSANYSWA